MQHACAACGAPLERVRAAPDPHYGLPIVTCPACGTSAVRTAHAQHRFRRRVARTGWSIGLLVLQAMLAIAAIASTSGICIFAVDRLTLDSGTLTMLSMFAVLMGLWMTVGLAHWPRFTAWPVFGVIVAVIVGVGPLVERPLDRINSGADVVAAALGSGVTLWGKRLLVLLMLLVVSLLAVPLGRAARRALEMGRHARIARHRTRVAAHLRKAGAR